MSLLVTSFEHKIATVLSSFYNYFESIKPSSGSSKLDLIFETFSWELFLVSKRFSSKSLFSRAVSNTFSAITSFDWEDKPAAYGDLLLRDTDLE